MKYIKPYILYITFCLAVVSCKKDLGNYDYTNSEVPTIDKSSLETSYKVQQFSNLMIDPKVDYRGDEKNLKYIWQTYSTSAMSNDPAVAISTERILNKTISIPPGSYNLELLVTDESNQMKTAFRTALTVESVIEAGWIVLHTINNESDVDYISTKQIIPAAIEKRVSNLFQAVLGHKLPGSGQMLGYSRQNFSNFNWITVGTDQEIRRMNGFTFAPMFTNEQMFRRKDFYPIKPQVHYNDYGFEMLINNGKLFPLIWLNPYYTDALYAGSYIGEYNLAPYIIFPKPQRPWLGFLVYDQLQGRFYRTGSINLTSPNLLDFRKPIDPAQQNQIPSYDLNAVNKEMLFMDRGRGLNNLTDNAYCFFKDRSNGAGRYMYRLDLSKTEDDGKLVIGIYDMSSLPEIGNAKFYAVGDLGSFALYATDKKIYRYDYAGTGQSFVSFDGIGSSERITKMKILKTNFINTSAEGSEQNNSVLYVATWDGNQGRLYELRLSLTDGKVLGQPLKIYEGFGEIKDMMFKHRGIGT